MCVRFGCGVLHFAWFSFLKLATCGAVHLREGWSSRGQDVELLAQPVRSYPR